MHHVLHQHELDREGETLAIEGEEARHAVRVKRLREGEPIVLLDGRGGRATGIVAGSDKNGPRDSWRLLVSIEHYRLIPQSSPAVHVLCPAPKGDLLESMIDQLSQVGAASWSPLETARSERPPRPGRLDRLRRVATESAKQCGRPWLLEIGEPVRFSDALSRPHAVLAAADGEAPGRLPHAGPDWGMEDISVLVGPEGGFSDAERRNAEEQALARVALGPHVLRIGTAAVLAAAAFVRVSNV
ncbi:MAG: RsmE family RNA methyltransferase [Planctomycetota bacterium]